MDPSATLFLGLIFIASALTIVSNNIHNSLTRTSSALFLGTVGVVACAIAMTEIVPGNFGLLVVAIVALTVLSIHVFMPTQEND